tara:strand:- start:5834 stop:6370 length:537 start_codon:yes stop_codon:yes gene_type:complete
MDKMTLDTSSTKGVFLLILAISGNFVAETLGCKTQKLLTNNMVAKHMVSIFVLYFSLGLFSDKKADPKQTIKMTLIIYIMFVLFTKMDIKFTIIVFSLLAINYIISNYVDYYNTFEESSDEYKKVQTLNKIQRYLITMIGILIIIGFTLYFKKQYKDYNKNWSTKHFLLGIKNCKSLN